MKTIQLLLVTILSVIIFSCKEEGPEIIANDPKEEMAVAVGMGEFMDLNAGHHLSGKVILLADPEDKKTLRFEEFSVVNGPDVNVYLSKTPVFQDVIDLGDLKATSGNVNYELDAAVDTKEYKYVLIWCVRYAVLFGYAEIK
jgi:hypothetical protein